MTSAITEIEPRFGLRPCRKYGRLPAAKMIDLIKKQKADGKIVVLATHAGLFARTLCEEAVLLRADKEAICGTQAFTKAE